MDKFVGYFKKEPGDVVYYCINENISIEDFITLELRAFEFVSNKKYRIFKTFDTQIDFTTVGKN